MLPLSKINMYKITNNLRKWENKTGGKPLELKMELNMKIALLMLWEKDALWTLERLRNINYEWVQKTINQIAFKISPRNSSILIHTRYKTTKRRTFYMHVTWLWIIYNISYTHSHFALFTLNLWEEKHTWKVAR